MNNPIPKLLSLPALAQTLHLPADWLRTEADAGRIPHFRVGRRLRFNLDAVTLVLADRAAQKQGGGHDPLC